MTRALFTALMRRVYESSLLGLAFSLLVHGLIDVANGRRGEAAVKFAIVVLLWEVRSWRKL